MESESSASMMRRAIEHHKQKAETEKAAAAMTPGVQGDPLKKAFTAVLSWFRGSRRPAVKESEYAALMARMEQLEARIRGLEERERPATPRRGEMALNLTTKSTALKLARSGQDAAQIARAVGVPLGEVSLLLKVERLAGQLRSGEAAQAK